MDYFENQLERSISKWPNRCQVFQHNTLDEHAQMQHHVQYMGRIQHHGLHPIHQDEHVNQNRNSYSTIETMQLNQLVID